MLLLRAPRLAGRRGLSVVSSPRVRVAIDDGIAVVTLARPEKMNALDLPMFLAIRDAAKKLAEHRDVRAVVLHGEGRAFCAGLDVKSILASGSAAKQLLERTGEANLAQEVSYLWRKIPAPVIAAVHGVCFGGGFQIALGADMRVAERSTKFSVMEAKWGIVPDMGASLTFPEVMARDVAKELAMTGRVFDADEARQLNVVTRVVEKDAFGEALNIAKQIAKRSPDSTAANKRLFDAAYDSPGGSDARLLKLETALQLRLLGTWNQLTSSALGLGAPAALTPGFANADLKWSEEADEVAQQKVEAMLQGVEAR
ncbi:ClpP/crotonase-like domain-containing protein [Pelagophyceae sp. CCMP2097]|nr:ClpP/crotonase-like domain-containing protein [Pelagophyceae sp. CCMP2097]|mmetsp:Transcript_30328/g.102332  ORF Transcript_30328/g.102332 Transcript_30328/m.102332 type:complete len:313 (-) Transcript_30328:178-1116(-)